MKIDIDGLQAFVRVAEHASFHKAAHELKLTQTALTRRVQHLESYLGLKLLDRTTRSVVLTTVGRDYFPQAQRIVEELTHSIDRLKTMSRASSGDVTMACLTSMGYHRLPAIIRAYATGHPDNRIRILDRTGAHVIEAVKQGHAEFGVTILPAREPDLEEEPVLQDPFMIYCLADHPIAARRRAKWQDLRGTELVAFGGASANRMLIEPQLTRASVRGRFEVEQFATAVDLVRAGAGIAVLPASAVLTQAYPEVLQIPLVRPVVKRTVGLIRRRGASLAPAARALYDLIVRELASGPPAGVSPPAAGLAGATNGASAETAAGRPRRPAQAR